MSSSSKKNTQKPVRPAKLNHRSTLSLSRTDIVINCYDLLPPGKLASVLWTFGTSLLHSGVVINGREYAFGGHDRRGMTGVYWTKPRLIPPGGTFKCEMLQGFTVSPQSEIDHIIHAASEEFQGTSYNLLTRNCNHFTAYLCEKLTGKPSPAWLNRASKIGVALPCLLPAEWVAPPDFESAEGELLLDEEEHRETERSRMLARTGSGMRHSYDDGRADLLDDWESVDSRGIDKRKSTVEEPVTDTSGRIVPQAERAPLAHR